MKNQNLKTLLPRVYLLAMSVAIAEPALGQGQQGGDRSRVLEEVIVTAEHRESRLQDTQISLTAFSDTKIQELGISNASEIGEYTPNVTMSPQLGGRNGFAVNMRGVRNGETLVSFEPAVGLYMDGVLIAKNSGALLDVVDPERIEVLRGPQGTLYGRNTIGGTINVVTKKPTDQFEGSFGVTLGNYSQRDARGVINVPILNSSSGVGALNLRASAATLNRDGFYDNRHPGAPQDEVQDRNRDVGLVHLQWQPRDSLEVLYSYDRSEIDESPLPSFTTFTNPARPTHGLLSPHTVREGDRPSSGRWDGDYFGESTAQGHAVNVSYELSEQLTFLSISAFRELEIEGGGDADGAPVPVLQTLDSSDSEIFTQEFRLVGTALASRLEYVVGVYYLDEDSEQSNGTVVFGNPSITNAEMNVTARALYGQATYALNERWDVTAGARYTEEERDMIKAVVGSSTQFPKADKNFDNITPMVSTSYDWTDDIMTYAKISRGYQSGGFNSRDANPIDFETGFDEEFLTAYEIGWKSTFADKRYRLNGAVFYSDYDDKQVNAFSPATLASVIRNAGEVEIWGVELEFLALVTENIELGFDYGYTDPEYKKFNDGQGGDLRDSNFPYTPKHNVHAFVRYEFPRLAIGLLSARVDWSYRDEITFLVPSPEINSGRSVQLWNARLTLSDIAGPGDTRMRTSLWGKNLADEEYWNFGVNIFSTFGFTINSYGDPRTFGVDFAIEF